MITQRSRFCRQCDEKFGVERHWQVFCGDKCRRKWNYLQRGVCFYCGEPGTSRDHVHPVAARGFKRRFMGQETVYCCTECNSMLGSSIFSSIEDRVTWIKNQYIQKYGLTHGVVDWEPEEMGELGWSLRARVKKMIAGRHRAERRVCYASAVFYELVQLNDSADLPNEKRDHEINLPTEDLTKYRTLAKQAADKIMTSYKATPKAEQSFEPPHD